MKANTNISLDVDLKKEAISLFKEFGLDLSTAVSLFLSQSVREQRIPFEITKNIPNKRTIEALKESMEMEKHPENYKHYDDVDELMEECLDDISNT